MGFRFRKRIRILPGFWFNLSKSGISTSVGGKGLTVNLKDGKTRTTVGIPGTGISYSESEMSADASNEASAHSHFPWLITLLTLAAIAAILLT
ncbi:MAG: DUF4236 domain-containing protein [Proteobacteria bacterium]|nr:DUF4236 domain-containing protein [Pseudomonadota bacterium]